MGGREEPVAILASPSDVLLKHEGRRTLYENPVRREEEKQKLVVINSDTDKPQLSSP